MPHDLRSISEPTASNNIFKHGFSAAELMAMEFPPIKYIVDGIVAEGVTLFVGAPKIGKSWMMLDIAIAVATGSEVFGSIRCEEGNVLYLALEDNQRRLFSRMRKLNVCPDIKTLEFSPALSPLDDGGAEEIAAWIEGAAKPKLVIVDVLARILPEAKGRETEYIRDYRAISAFQEIASKYGIAILVVHHMRKAKADDPTDGSSGTRGLTGAADSTLTLERDFGSGRTVLYGRGRDIEEFETVVSFDKEICRWSIVGAVADFARTEERQAILDALQKAEQPQNAREVARCINHSYEAVRKTLSRMAQNGEVEKAGRGSYTCPKRPNVTNSADEPADWDKGTDETDVLSG